MVRPACWTPCIDDDASGSVDGFLWHKGLGNHAYGEFSMAVIQANNSLEDQSQLESGPLSSMESGPKGTFVGIYDGHAGNEASRFISHNLFSNFKTHVTEHQEVSANVIKKSFLATEESFLSFVRKQWLRKPQLASVGSCCLVGVLCDGKLYTANAGDSRVVLGRMGRGTREVTAIQLSVEHNADIESVRDELRSLHPDDPHIVVLRNKVWRVKGLIQVSRSIGDAYLKKCEFNKEPLPMKFRLPKPFQKPILSPEPAISVHKLQPEDRFLIFASDGLWEQLTNQEAVEIVHSSPRNGIAKRLIKAALLEAAKRREMRYSDLKRIDPGVRRYFHDDITVVVVYIDTHSIKGISSSPFSIRGLPTAAGL